MSYMYHLLVAEVREKYLYVKKCKSIYEAFFLVFWLNIILQVYFECCMVYSIIFKPHTILCASFRSFLHMIQWMTIYQDFWLLFFLGKNLPDLILEMFIVNLQSVNMYLLLLWDFTNIDNSATKCLSNNHRRKVRWLKKPHGFPNKNVWTLTMSGIYLQRFEHF